LRLYRPDSATETQVNDFDVVVAGAGMAGLVAAAALSQAGVRTLVIEKGPEVGGSMRLSGGTIWTAASMEFMEQHMPGGSRELQQHIVESLPECLEWLAGLGVPNYDLDVGEGKFGREVDVNLLSRRLSAVITSGDGSISRRTELVDLRVGASGAISGIGIEADSEPRNLVVGDVILATGGFQGGSDLVKRYIPGWPENLMLRSNPQSDGAALRAAVAVGAGTSTEMDGFYGHTMPDIDIPPSRWIEVTAYFTQDAVLVDESGQRFFDESTSLTDEIAPMEIVRRPGARAILLIDDRIYQGGDPVHGSPQARRAKPAFDASQELGAPNIVADSWEEIGEGVQRMGIDGAQLLRTITEYNAAILSGNADRLKVPRTRHRAPLVVPPFRALAVRPGITFTLGGIRVDSAMRVLREDGTHVAGLYAAGADAGGAYGGGYMGGLAMALVQGRLAAHSILEHRA
jgi:succinate dehydrogenase/fumarate reductase flavoprotein subunit